VLFRSDYGTPSQLFYLLAWPVSYIIDLVAYLWLIVALISYAVLNSFQISASNYFYKDLTSKIQVTTTLNHKSTKLPAELYIPNGMGSNNTIDDSWSKLLHNIFKSKLSVDRLSNLDSLNLVSSKASYASESPSLALFANVSTNNFINSTRISHYSYLCNKACLDSSASLMQDRYYNSSISIAKLGDKDFYTNSIKENLSLANQTRWSFKMSSISEKLVRDNFNYTQAKQLLGSSAATSASSTNNVWTSSNLSKIKDLSGSTLSRNITALNFFEDGRSWTNKKLFFNSDNSFYKLSYEPYSAVKDSLTRNPNSSVIAAYNLDYSLSSSLIKLPNSSENNLLTDLNYKNLFTVNTDKTVYQDSYNNFLFTMSTTTLVNTRSAYAYSNCKPKNFSFI
jgi:hypothetical protein